MRKRFLTGTALMAMLWAAPAAAAPGPWTAVGETLGKAGTELPGGVYRVALPRSDLKVTLAGVAIKPALALGSWVAFLPMGKDAMVMGDLVLTQDEIEPVMKRLAEGGFEITALHNHLLRAEPMTMYMHIDGHGDPVKLAQTLHAALLLTSTPLGAAANAVPPKPLDLDTAMLDRILGRTGKASGEVYQFTIPRAETLTSDTTALPVAMGTGIAINFQPTGGGKAAIAGDFVLIASEVNPVLRTLRDHGIAVTALHNHMLNDQPRLFFMHFWANDDADRLAQGLKAALDQMNLKKG
ncbi:DUF1259 domain-containing protein [Gluconacetobacter azotocaptans]|uniref:DUF1259 domain-containing protein n=2 Tax=Gluconacetobacter azotocaptans TaxID=142834 RepID=A0A7W4JP43_9PROT|nr:DUF1259 domain-containing protein [Gluconacetobacter azotocaptans]GBQ27645.1 hypothetical protein AA13594_0676 [Gluconacetobacter azotocaptans DSM 13594]